MILTPIMGCFTPDCVNGCIKAGMQGSDDASSGGSDGAGSDGAEDHHQEQQPVKIIKHLIVGTWPLLVRIPLICVHLI